MRKCLRLIGPWACLSSILLVKDGCVRAISLETVLPLGRLCLAMWESTRARHGEQVPPLQEVFQDTQLWTDLLTPLTTGGQGYLRMACFRSEPGAGPLDGTQRLCPYLSPSLQCSKGQIPGVCRISAVVSSSQDPFRNHWCNPEKPEGAGGVWARLSSSCWSFQGIACNLQWLSPPSIFPAPGKGPSQEKGTAPIAAHSLGSRGTCSSSQEPGSLWVPALPATLFWRRIWPAFLLLGTHKI